MNRQSNSSHPGSLFERIRSDIETRFGKTADLEMVTLQAGGQKGILFYLSTLTNPAFIMDNIIKPLSLFNQSEGSKEEDRLQLQLQEQFLPALSGKMTSDLNELSLLLTDGHAGICFEKDQKVLLLDVKKLEVRAVSEPTSQNVTRGPKEGFTESAETNMSLIRRRVQNEKLRFEKFEIGKLTRTSVYLAYMEGETVKGVLEQVREQLSSSKLNQLFDSSSLEAAFQSKELNLFPTTYNSERPDTISNLLLNHRIAIIVDGSPFVLAVPSIFKDYFKSSEDNYQWFTFGLFIRYLRYISFFFSMCLPALYVAITNYHQELIPTTLLTTIAAQREGISFPAVIEILLLEITFEILREAGTRMPRIVGQSISIAGALVLGQAAVLAGLVSNISVIVVSLGVISGFVSPVYTFGTRIRLFRYGLIVLGSVLGLFGVIFGCAFLLIHLSKMESFGVAYFSSSLSTSIKGQIEHET